MAFSIDSNENYPGFVSVCMCCIFATNHHLIIVGYIRGLFDVKMQCMRTFTGSGSYVLSPIHLDYFAGDMPGVIGR